MTLTTDDVHAIREQAFREAADLLEKSAADYVAMADRLEGQPARSLLGGARDILANGAREMRDKAKLLRRHAGHIRKIRV